MKSITINQVRVRLGKIMERVFTPSFHDVYEDIAEQMGGDVEKLMAIINSHADTIDAYVHVLSEHLLDTNTIERINCFVHPLVAYGFYNRYYILSRCLMEKNQEELLMVAAPEKDFFTDILISYWRDNCLESPRNQS